MLVFFLLPLLLVLAISFASRGPYGGVQWAFSLANYAMMFDPLYARIYGRSLLLAVATKVICLLIGYPLACGGKVSGCSW
jgi:spermidine/putrescine transport system permease protein